jgi:hypothetical protein
MIARLDNLAVVDDDNLVSIPDRAQARWATMTTVLPR